VVWGSGDLSATSYKGDQGGINGAKGSHALRGGSEKGKGEGDKSNHVIESIQEWALRETSRWLGRYGGLRKERGKEKMAEKCYVGLRRQHEYRLQRDPDSPREGIEKDRDLRH